MGGLGFSGLGFRSLGFRACHMMMRLGIGYFGLKYGQLL